MTEKDYCKMCDSDSMLRCLDCESNDGQRPTQFKTITNADLIRNMTDEKLANVFAMISDCISCNCGSAEDDCSIVDGTCQQQWLKWLRKEADSQDLHTP